MQNHYQFRDVIYYALRSVPYIFQSHTCKAYCALESLYAQKPHLPNDVWEYCTSIIKNDEPKVNGIIIPDLLNLDEVLDATSGRRFGPDWILGRGLVPLSYWAMQKKVVHDGFKSVFMEYVTKALEKPRYLGHEISVLSAYWYFYNEVIAESTNEEDKTLFIQRFTEFVTVTFSHGDENTVEHSLHEENPSESEIIFQALNNPGFFGHHVLASVWGFRLKPLLEEEQKQLLTQSLITLNGGYGVELASSVIKPIKPIWSEQDFDTHMIRFFLEGPHNIHQITLAEALLWCWVHHPEHRGLVAANLICFTEGTRP